MTTPMPIKLLGTGAYVPEQVRTNADFAEYLDTNDEWIVTRTGIRERHYAAPDQAASDLAIIACQRALDDANLTIKDVDLILCATATGDHQFPATACFIHAGLDAGEIPAFDVSAACSGFLYALTVASSMLVAGMYKRVLVVGAEALTRFADMQDRTTCVLFGDAAGAAVVTLADQPNQGIRYWSLGTDGTKSKLIWVPSGGSRLPSSETTIAERLGFLHMKGREVFKFAVVKMQQLIDDALAELSISPDELAMIIPHQSNLRIIESARERLGLSRDKVAINIERYGNTSAASVMLSLDEALRSGRLKTGDLILLIAIGAGLTWSIMVLQL